MFVCCVWLCWVCLLCCVLQGVCVCGVLFVSLLFVAVCGVCLFALFVNVSMLFVCSVFKVTLLSGVCY